MSPITESTVVECDMASSTRITLKLSVKQIKSIQRKLGKSLKQASNAIKLPAEHVDIASAESKLNNFSQEMALEALDSPSVSSSGSISDANNDSFDLISTIAK